MKSLDALTRRIVTTRQLRSIVGTMRSFSAISIHQYEEAAAALRLYRETVEWGISAALRRYRPRPAVPQDGAGLVVVACGTDRGMCGRLNELVADTALAALGRSDGTSDGIIAIGARLAGELERLGHTPWAEVQLPNAAAGLARAANDVVLRLDTRMPEPGLDRVLVVHSRRKSRTVVVPEIVQLLPLAPEHLRQLASRPWHSRSLPAHTLPAERLYALLLRHHLFGSLAEALAEALASEHTARLAAMHAAERNIDEHLADLLAESHRMRQEAITEELLDVVSGFEVAERRGRG
ncbi:MAG TPA: F0F1 ATP synthase subunit gamma [Gemmatimonadales bacterium]|nr:F0F1 ATP synthase subunit gamma [Gemmatimonadales bacterium]